jgi:hypothetical protein
MPKIRIKKRSVILDAFELPRGVYRESHKLRRSQDNLPRSNHVRTHRSGFQPVFKERPQMFETERVQFLRLDQLRFNCEMFDCFRPITMFHTVRR